MCVCECMSSDMPLLDTSMISDAYLYSCLLLFFFDFFLYQVFG